MRSKKSGITLVDKRLIVDAEKMNFDKILYDLKSPFCKFCIILIHILNMN